MSRPGGRARWTSGARASPDEARHERLDPIQLQVISGSLRAACEEMGAVLIRSARSSNIKERHDASTALFDRQRRDGDAGRAHPRPSRLDARRGGGDPGRGPRAWQLWVLNDPFAGGTHLPDITVITPVLVDGALLGFAAEPRAPRRRRRAHPRVDARGQPHAGGRGRRDRPDPPGRGHPERAVRANAPAGRARSGPARPAGRQPHWARCA